MRRKIICMALTLLLVGTLAAVAFAAGTASLTVSSTSLNRGSVFTVAAKLSGMEKTSAGSATITYDSGLELTDISSDSVTVVPDLAKGRAVFYAMSSTDMNGSLLVLTFRVKADAAFADNKITVQFDINGENPSASATVNIACAHNFSEWADYSATVHFRKCSICGREETADHSYDNDCDTACNGCGRERTITHQFSSAWTGDESGHYHTCSVCGTKDEVQKHNPGEPAGEYTDQTCTVCQFVLTPALGHTHKYDDAYSYDENGHWQICTGCKESTEAQEHVFDGDCDESCDICDCQREIEHPVEGWESSEDSHWKTCTNCGEMLEQAQHSWDAGYVKTQATTQNTGLVIYHCTTCMAQRQEVLPKALPTDPAGGWAWWIWMAIGGGGGIVAASLVWILVVVINVKRKSKGRFSG